MNPSIIHLRISRSLIVLVGLTWSLGLMFGLGFLSNYTFWAAACFTGWWLALLVRFGLLTWQHVYLSDQGIRVKNYTGDYTFAWNTLHAIEFVTEPAAPRFMDRDLSYLWATYAVRFSDAQRSIIVHTRFTEHDRTLFKTKLAHYIQHYAIPNKTIDTLDYPVIYPERLSIWQKLMRLHRPPLIKSLEILRRFCWCLLAIAMIYAAVTEQEFFVALTAFAIYQVLKLGLALLPNAIKQPDLLIKPQESALYVPKLVDKTLFARLLGFYGLIVVLISIYYGIVGF
ncbi:MAG TPA: hypothetical protein DEF47_18420 [Herpetosiphon sp.]|uniref:Uncharacterized protein n=1 Tax=Herpetosiphon aurantiacus (strain ATCC 23779 / DSM 785 / 114-95) TaxID=316274 RepID=A9B555_HERA2|nr:hypothetical protein [Herpetosiphon sp.]ABX06192.1 hypothetical protein Haur_3556 [Herpetosiphon aurantiacus DSM 785]HBW51868.1 hypothetical protein [Herpetosiphon sp.]